MNINEFEKITKFIACITNNDRLVYNAKLRLQVILSMKKYFNSNDNYSSLYRKYINELVENDLRKNRRHYIVYFDEFAFSDKILVPYMDEFIRLEISGKYPKFYTGSISVGKAFPKINKPYLDKENSSNSSKKHKKY